MAELLPALIITMSVGVAVLMLTLYLVRVMKPGRLKVSAGLWGISLEADSGAELRGHGHQKTIGEES